MGDNLRRLGIEGFLTFNAAERQRLGLKWPADVAELVATCSPSILVPYPYAADDHQRFNAQSIAEAGGAEVILNQDIGERLGESVFYYESNREALRTMRESLRKIRGVPAAEAVTRECLAMMVTGR